MPISLEIVGSSKRCTLNPVVLSDNSCRFTEIYEVILNDSSLVESELLELHKLILRKLTPYK